MSLLSPRAGIEILESRIAPAIIFTGAPGDPNDTQYTDAPFHKTTDASDPFGANFVGGSNTFYVKLSKGDLLLRATGVEPLELIKITSGNVIAFFQDKNSNNEVDLNELTGLSLGKNAVLTIKGNVDGDIITNFNEATGLIDQTGLVSNLQAIKQLTVDNVSGDVIAGGPIFSTTGKTLDEILTGTAANGYSYDFNSSDSGGGSTLSVVAAAGQAGPGIFKTNVSAISRIQASDGGAGAVGGAITGVSIASDTNGFTIHGGNGGAGIALKTNGGAGGSVSQVVARGVSDLSNNSSIQIFGGDGGDAFGAAKGGLGGSVQRIFVGYDSALTAALSPNSLHDDVLVAGGHGGSGKLGGGGGNLSDIHASVAAPNAGGDEIRILGGAGGDNVTAGAGAKAGIGGSIKTVDAIDVDAGATGAGIVVHGGDGGATPGDGAGANGGSVLSVKLLGYALDVSGGDGSSGVVSGGMGGGLKSILIDEGANGVRANSATINGGQGGDASTGKGGSGGAISGLEIRNGDLTSLAINTGTHANGGISGNNVGGAGGAVSALRIVDVSGSGQGAFNLRAGAGADGVKGGGVGGSISNVILSGHELSIASVAAGGGGSATVSGSGGKGGSLAGLSLTSDGQVSGLDVVANLLSGAGGDGFLNGGAAGNIAQVSATVDGAVALTAGNGGSGGTGAAGKGGSIAFAHALSQNGAATVIAGDAGASGAKPGLGGSITGASGFLAATNITVHAGNGSNGGAGGSISNVAVSDPQSQATAGRIELIAGDGSGGTSLAGKGGSISNVTAIVGSSGANSILAGDGGASATKAGAGGSVANVNIFGGGGGGAVFKIEAGDGGSASSAAAGGAGGSVQGIHALQLEAGTNFLHVAAGNGGSTGLVNGKGGLGGSVNDLTVQDDIGVRSGQAFGFDTMGGIFAGSGGTGGAKDGLAGNVTNVTATAIAAIVAGHPGTNSTITAANLVTRVDHIILNNRSALLVVPTVDGTGHYTNLATANFVGAIANPNGPGAAYPAAHPHVNTFDPGVEFIDNDGSGDFSIGDTTNGATDGFIAARFLGSKNFVPEAFLTLDANGGSVFVDLNNTNGQKLA